MSRRSNDTNPAAAPRSPWADVGLGVFLVTRRGFSEWIDRAHRGDPVAGEVVAAVSGLLESPKGSACLYCGGVWRPFSSALVVVALDRAYRICTFCSDARRRRAAA
jgi:hypothetical protein